MIIAVNEKELYINSQKINTIILINSTCEIKFRGIIYNFVKLFFKIITLILMNKQISIIF